MPLGTNEATTTYKLDTDGHPELIFPKVAFANAEEFYNDFSQAAIPFMGDYKIQMVPDKDPVTLKDNVCYKQATSLTAMASTTLAAVALFTYLN